MTEPTPPPPSRRGLYVRLAVVALVAAAIASFYLSGLHERFRWDEVRGHVDTWKAAVDDNFAVSLLAFFGIYVAFTALSLPAALVLTLTAGALFGRVAGVAVTSVASTCGATLAMLTSRYLLRDFVRRTFADRLAPIDRGVERDGAWYLFMMRINPVVPYFLINLGMGLTPMPVRVFVPVSWLGMIAPSIVIVNAGTELGGIRNPRDALSLPVVAGLALLGLAPLVIRILFRRFAKPPEA